VRDQRSCPACRPGATGPFPGPACRFGSPSLILTMPTLLPRADAANEGCSPVLDRRSAPGRGCRAPALSLFGGEAP
jgi:hypothetical protein